MLGHARPGGGGDEHRRRRDVERVRRVAAGPTMSTRRSRSATSTLVDNSRITCAAAAISPIVSFLTRRPTVSAAIITGDTSPLMIWRISASISSWKISRCSIVRCTASESVSCMTSPRSSSRAADPCPRLARSGNSGASLAVLGEDRLRMELYALDRVLAMAHAHDLAVVGARGDFETRRHAVRRDRQRVVARHRKRRGRCPRTRRGRRASRRRSCRASRAGRGRSSRRTPGRWPGGRGTRRGSESCRRTARISGTRDAGLVRRARARARSRLRRAPAPRSGRA